MKKIFIIVFLVLVVVFFVRFVIGGPEDTWICVNGQWVRHGNPSAPMPESGCGESVTVNEDNQGSDDASVCQSQTGASMSLSDARVISERDCLGGELKNAYSCNDYTGSWWIDFEPNEPKEGCNPACVVDVKNKTAEINWRCTGLIPE